MSSTGGTEAHGHPHPHDDHEHGPDGHEHPAATEHMPEPSGPGTVVVDIGGDIGAAVVNTPADFDGLEIEIRDEPGEWAGRHVAVRPRPMPDRTIYAAFFDRLHEGRYVLRVRFGEPGATEVPLEVNGGRVSFVTWPED